ncbi:LamG domain-containing protein [Candidatus Poribacteria bacterium]|nr:LamG domain-containing protein [Candidatus Poribacteria bacterium]
MKVTQGLLLPLLFLCSVLAVIFPSVGKGVADKSLVLCFSFEEAEGKETKDLSGNDNTGAVNGAKWTEDGKRGKALYFDGTSSYVEVSDSKSLNMTDAITVEAWIYAESYPGDYPRIVMKGYGTAYELDAKNTNSIDWEANVGGWHECNSGANTIALKRWHHVAGTFDGKAMKAFIDGVEKISCPFSGKLGTTNDVLQIGAYTPKGSVHFHGVIDEVAIYNRVLSLAEIKQDMEEGILPTTVNTLGKLAITWSRIRTSY